MQLNALTRGYLTDHTPPTPLTQVILTYSTLNFTKQFELMFMHFHVTQLLPRILLHFMPNRTEICHIRVNEISFGVASKSEYAYIAF